jgi:hypothetical protein
MDARHVVRDFAYVDRAFRDVRRHVADAPQRVVGAPTAPLHAQRMGVDVRRDVRITIGDMEVWPRGARLPLRWEDAGQPGMFPVLDAVLEFSPVRSGAHDMTQVALFGHYQPPLGLVGDLADDLAGRGVVVESIEEFLVGLAGRLEAEIPAPNHTNAD